MVGVEAAFAIDAVEGAHFPVGRHEVDAERYAQTAAVHRAEDWRWIDDGRQFYFTILRFSEDKITILDGEEQLFLVFYAIEGINS